jgi:hypothetical protein
VNTITQKDLYTLKRQQIQILKHAFKFKSAKNIMYIARSFHDEETNQVVEDVLERYGVEWKLTPVLPEIQKSATKAVQKSCFLIEPSPTQGNGIFIAHFTMIPKIIERELQDLTLAALDMEARDSSCIKQDRNDIKKSHTELHEERKTEKKKAKLTKKLRESVERLSNHRLSTTKPKEVSKADSNKNLCKSTSAATVDNGDVAESSENIAEDPEQPKFEDNIIVYGMSLKKFYNPKVLALESMKKISDLTPSRRWVYPVNTINIGS